MKNSIKFCENLFHYVCLSSLQYCYYRYYCQSKRVAIVAVNNPTKLNYQNPLPPPQEQHQQLSSATEFFSFLHLNDDNDRPGQRNRAGLLPSPKEIRNFRPKRISHCAGRNLRRRRRRQRRILRCCWQLPGLGLLTGSS